MAVYILTLYVIDIFDFIFLRSQKMQIFAEICLGNILSIREKTEKKLRLIWKQYINLQNNYTVINQVI